MVVLLLDTVSRLLTLALTEPHMVSGFGEVSVRGDFCTCAVLAVPVGAGSGAVAPLPLLIGECDLLPEGRLGPVGPLGTSRLNPYTAPALASTEVGTIPGLLILTTLGPNAVACETLDLIY